MLPLIHTTAALTATLPRRISYHDAGKVHRIDVTNDTRAWAPVLARDAMPPPRHRWSLHAVQCVVLCVTSLSFVHLRCSVSQQHSRCVFVLHDFCFHRLPRACHVGVVHLSSELNVVHRSDCACRTPMKHTHTHRMVHHFQYILTLLCTLIHSHSPHGARHASPSNS